MSETTNMTGNGNILSNRWLQLIFGIICMSMIANMQYGWTLFVEPMKTAHPGWTKAMIQVAFTLFVLFETWLVPIEGWLVDKFGPRPVVASGGLLCGIAWILNSQAETLSALYFAGALGGLGAGAVYGTCVGNALKWFPDKRGLAAGLTAAGFGMGSAITIVPISNMIKHSGYQAAFFNFGLLQGAVCILLGLFLVKPFYHGPINVSQTIKQSRRDYKLSEMLRTPVFWVMYAMFVSVAAGGLIATAQLGSLAKDWHLDKTAVTLIGFTMPALTMALSLDRVLNGLTRPFFGWVSDKIGREQTMFLAFLAEGLGIFALWKFGANPVTFVLLTGIVFFAWGEIYSLFPSTCTDTFGSKNAAGNAGMLYTAKGTASLLVPIGAWLVSATGGWTVVFIVAAVLNIGAALAAKFILAPMRRDFIARSASEAGTAEIAAKPVFNSQ